MYLTLHDSLYLSLLLIFNIHISYLLFIYSLFPIKGNIRQGIKSANDINDIELYQECGDILEQQKQYQEAAEIHLKANQYERAAFIFIKYLAKTDKSKINETAKILENVRNDQLNIGFAKLCIGFNRYDVAMEAYMRAKDLDKVVELKLRHLDQIQDAFDIVSVTRTL